MVETNYEIIKIVEDDENYIQHNQYADALKRQMEDKNKPKTDKRKRKGDQFEDDLLYCYECNEEYVGECTDHKSQWILNKKIDCPFTALRPDHMFDEYYNENLNITECFCKKNNIKHIKTTLPSGFFLVKSQIANTTYGVWTKYGIGRGTILGPFLGKLTTDNTVTGVVTNSIEDGVNDFVWSLMPTNNVGDYSLIDFRDCMRTNYLRFIRRSSNDGEHNLIPVQFDGKIFYQANKDIGSIEELLVTYEVRSLHSQYHQNSITIRMMPSNDIPSIGLEKPIVKMSSDNDLSAQLDDIDAIESTLSPDQHASNAYHPNIVDNTYSSHRTYGFQPKVDDDMKQFLKDFLQDHPNVTGGDANKAMQKMMPDKPILATRTVLSIISKYGYRPIIGSDDVLDDNRVALLIQMFKDNPDLSCRDAKIKIENLYPTKPPVTYETIDRIIRTNNLQNPFSPRRKLDSTMCGYVSKLLKRDPWMRTKDLNMSLQKAFPMKPKISKDYLNQVISLRRLRPIESARKKMTDTMKKFVYDLYYGDNLTCSEICRRMNAKFVDMPYVSEGSIGRLIAKHKQSYCSDNSN